MCPWALDTKIVLNPILHVSINLHVQKYCKVCFLCHQCEETVSRDKPHMLPPTHRLQSHLTVNRHLCGFLCPLPVQAVTAD